MSIIYSYPEQGALNANDLLIGTSAEKVGGKQKNITRNFSIQQIADFINRGAGFVDPVASDFQIPVFNQEGKKITGSIMSQDSSPSNGAAGSAITIAGSLVTTGDLTSPGVVTIGGGTNLITLNSETYLKGSLRDSANVLGADKQILLSDQFGYTTWTNYEAGLTYEGTWDANANTTNGLSNSPALVQGAGVSGHFYIVNVEGTTSLGPGLNDWHVGDWAVFLDEGGQPASWQKIDNTSVLTGSGTDGVFARWTDATTINDSLMSQVGTEVIINGELKVKDTIQATTGPSTNLKLKGVGTGGIEIMSADGFTDGKIQLNCSQNSHGVTLQSPPHASGATYTLVLPTNFGGAGDVLTSAGANPSQLVWTTPTTGTVTGTGTQNYVTKWSAGGAGIENSTIFDNGTNVGIGTTSPSAKLDVAGDILSTGDITIDNSTGDPFLKLKTNAQEYVLRIDQSDGEKFQIRDITNSLTPFTINTAGNVGIGTSSPEELFHVNKDASGDVVLGLFENGTNGAGTSASLQLKNHHDVCSTVLSSYRNGANFGADFIVKTSNGSNGSIDEVFRITESGNVGIGTTSPGAKLEVNGGIRAIGGQIDASPYVGAFRFYDGAIYRGGLGTGQWSGVGNSADIVQSLNNVNYFISNSQTALVKVESGGNVGIGTSSPGTKLDVNGSIKAAGNAKLSSTAPALKFEETDRTDENWAFIASGGKLSIRTANDNFSSYDVKMLINQSGNVGIGTTSPAVSLDISATDAVQMPVGITTDRPLTGVSNGMLRYNSTNNEFEGYINGNWGSIGGGTSGGLVFRGTFDASTGAIASGGSLYTCPAGGSGGTVDTAIGDLYIVTTAGSFFCSGTSLNVGDEVICITAATATNDNVNNWNAIASGAGGAVTGSGTTNYVPKFTGATVVGNSSIFNDASGNVGIGTTSPDRTLSIKGNSATNIPLTVESGTGQLNCLIAMRDSNTTTPYKVAIGSATDDMIFRAGGAERMRIDSAGDIGIGTTSPSKKLHVSSGDQSTSRIRLSNTNTGGNDIDLVAGINNVGQDGFSIYNATSNQTQLVVQSGGNVGIGTTSPVSALHVSTTVNEVLTLQSITSSQKIKFNDINNPADDSDFGSVSGDLAMFTNSSGTPNTQSFTFNKDGKLGIGQFSTSPQANLDISDLNFNPSLRLYGANTGSELKIEVSNFFGNFNTTINSAQNDLIFQGNNSAIMSLGVSGSSPSLPTGSLRLNQYGQGNKTGTAVYNLTVDGFGNVIEDPISGGASATITSRQTTTTSATTVFLLGATPNGNSVNFVDVFIDGVYQETTTYSVSGASFDEITFNSPVPSGVTVETKTTADYNVGAAVDTVSLGQSNTTGNVDLRIVPLEVTSGQTIPGNANSLYIFTATGAQSIATVTLPGSPTLGDSIKISNLGGLANVLGANGNKIMGVAADLTINTPTAAFEIIWSGSNNGWIIIGNV